MAIDVEAVRAATPGCDEVIHFNNAGASLPPAPVLETVIEHLRLEARIGGYEAATAAAERLTGSYAALARLVNARPDEIAYVENATRAWDMAFYAIPFRPGDRVLTTTSEYASNAIAYLQLTRSRGISVEVVPDDEHGQISLQALHEMLSRGGVRLVAINHIPTHDGLVNPAAAVGALARGAGALYLLDACQSVGQIRVDVAEIGCDMLSATGRKFLRGPRGTGFLYVRRGVLDQLEPPFLDLCSATWTGPDSYEISPGARRFEAWERFVAGQLGLGAAADYATETVGMAAIEDRVAELAGVLRAGLAEVPGVTVHDRGARRGAIVTFTREGFEPAEIKKLLAADAINVNVTESGYRFDSGHGMPRSRVRASAHYFNTQDEVTRLVSAVAAL